MKIAIVNGIYFPEPGGAQTQSHNITNKLHELGNKVDCYIFNKTNIRNNFYEIIILNKLLLTIVYFFYYYLNIDISLILNNYFKKIIKEKNYDVWHFNHINFKSLIIINILKSLNQKILVTFQGADIQIEKKINYGYRINKKYDHYLKKTIENIDAFASISKNITKDLLDIGVKKKKIFQIPNAVERKKFRNLKKIYKKMIILLVLSQLQDLLKKKGL